MISFTEKGAEKVQEFLASQSADVQTSGLRVGVRGGGCSGFQYALAFDSERDGDTVFEDHGLRILPTGLFVQAVPLAVALEPLPHAVARNPAQPGGDR